MWIDKFKNYDSGFYFQEIKNTPKIFPVQIS